MSDPKGKTPSIEIEIFRAGRHTAMNGAEVEFSDQDLAAAASAYSPSVHEAPLVVGHPKNDDPAYGWVQNLSYVEGSLVATPHQVNADFAELVNGGAYKKISASFYTPDAESNPSPGVYYLRHVGFLGAQAPSLKGLKQVAFGEDEDGVVSLEFSDVNVEAGWALRRVARTFRSIREFFIEEFGRETADTVFDGWDVEGLESEAANVIADADDKSFSEDGDVTGLKSKTQEESEMPDKTAAATADQLAAEAKQLEDDRTAFQAERTEFAEKAARSDAEAFLKPHLDEGRVLPAERDGLVEFMAGLGAEESVSFGEGGDKTPLEFFKGFIASLPERVDFSERSKSDGESDIDATDSEALAEAGLAYQEEMRAKGVTIDIATAIRRVEKKEG